MASIRLSGADRLTWLQGQVTNDVFASSRFCLCAPNGQIEGVFSMWAEGESHALESTVSGCEALLRRVADFVILEDVVAVALPPGEEGVPRLAGGRAVVSPSPSPREGEVREQSERGGGNGEFTQGSQRNESSQGPPPPTASGLPPLGGEDLPRLQESGAQSPSSGEGDVHAKQEQGAGLPGLEPSPSDPSGATFPSEEGKALVSRRDAESAELGSASPSPGSQEKVPRLAGGDEVDSGKQAYPLSPSVGEGASSFDSLSAGEIDPRFDIPPGTVPADLGERFFNAHVSLTKGCYTGQEVIHRMHARGAGKKTWVVLELRKPPKDPSAFTRWATDGTRILAGAFVPRPQAIVGEEIVAGGTSARIVMLG